MSEQLRKVASLGYELSTWVAAIRWDGGRNLPEYLSNLRELGEDYQSAYAALSPEDRLAEKATMRTEAIL